MYWLIKELKQIDINEIFNIKRNVTNKIDKYDKYDSLILLNNQFIENIEFDKDILVLYDYSYASNLLNITNMLYYIFSVSKIMLDKDIVYINYNKSSKSKLINIQKLSSIPNDKLIDIMNTNDEIDGISRNVTIDELRHNHYRVGVQDIIDDRIIRLVEYNKYISFKIRKLDNEIYCKIDSILNR